MGFPVKTSQTKTEKYGVFICSFDYLSRNLEDVDPNKFTPLAIQNPTGDCLYSRTGGSDWPTPRPTPIWYT